MKSVFSFCIYGSNIMYYKGLLDNINIIKNDYPEFYIYIYYGIDHRNEWLDKYSNSYDKVTLIPTYKTSTINMLFRYMPLLDKNIKFLFARDADSEINKRDQWCIQQFINSSYHSHTIRDHYWHKSKLTGGLTGFRVDMLSTSIKNKIEDCIKKIETIEKINYGEDENYISKNIYPLLSDNLLIHTNINAFCGEKYKLIEYINDGINFVGNTLEYKGDTKVPKFKYWDFPLETQLKFLNENKQYHLVNHITENIADRQDTEKVLDEMFIAFYYTNNIEKCICVAKKLEFVGISDHIISNFDYLFHLLRSRGKKITGTTEITYEPSENEIVVYYGSYPITHNMFPVSNKVYRNAYFFN